MNVFLERTSIMILFSLLFLTITGCGNEKLQNEINELKKDKESLEKKLEIISKERDSLKTIMNEQEKIKNKNLKPNLVLLNKSNELTNDGYYLVEATIKNIGQGDAKNIEVYFTNAKSFSKLEEIRKEFKKLINEHNKKYPEESFDEYDIKSLLYSKYSYLYHYAFINYLPSQETIKIRTSKIPKSTLTEEIAVRTKADDGISSTVQIRYLAKMVGLCGSNFLWKYSK